MKVLLVGNGGREHAMAAALCRSGLGVQFYVFASAKNPGISRLVREHHGEMIIGDINDGDAVAKWALDKKAELALIGPDAVLEAGVVDELQKAGVACASPEREAARLEWDKPFARDLMKKHSVPGLPAFGVFADNKLAARMIDDLDGNVAIKPAGLTAGKGVKVMGAQLNSIGEAKKYAEEIIEKRIGGIPAVVVEERLEGEEFTLQAFVDGENVVGMPAVQDHKRAFEGDVGPNTGGMGSYSDADGLLPFMKKENYDVGLDIMRKTVAALKKETGVSYRGILYGQFMLTAVGPVVIEFNARFGDPEGMNVLTLLESDFLEISKQVAGGGLSGNIKFAQAATVCKYLVPAGYPDKPAKNSPVIVDEWAIRKAGAHLYYGSVNQPEGDLEANVMYTSTSRTVGIVGVSDTIEEAEKVAEYSTRFVTGEVAHRKDIGTKGLIQKRIDHMKLITG